MDALRQEFGDFDSFHVRRGDFQFKRTRIEATEIYDNVKNVLPDNRTLFIATDERNKSFFDPLKEHYTVRFLDDYKHLLIGVNTYVCESWVKLFLFDCLFLTIGRYPSQELLWNDRSVSGLSRPTLFVSDIHGMYTTPATVPRLCSH